MDNLNPNMDLIKLKNEAEDHELKESYLTVKKTPDYKIGLGVRALDNSEYYFFIEVVFALCQEEEVFKVSNLKTRLDSFERFEKYGYSLKCEKDNTIICEKNVEENEIEIEIKKICLFMENIDV